MASIFSNLARTAIPTGGQVGPQIPFGGLGLNQFFSNPQAIAGLGLLGGQLQNFGQPQQQRDPLGGLGGLGGLLALLRQGQGGNNLNTSSNLGLLGLLGR